MIVYSYYVLDIVHKGHLEQMMNAKGATGKDGISVVGILTNEAVMEKKEKPILSLDERIALARAIKYNDIVIVQDTYSPLPNIANIKPDIMMESSSHDRASIKVMRLWLYRQGIKVIVTPYYPNQSSTEIKNKIKGPYYG